MAVSTKRIEIDENNVWFFLDNGNVVAIKHCGSSLEAIEVRGSVSLSLGQGIELKLPASDSVVAQQASASEQDNPFATFHLMPPIKVMDIGSYRDGGTVAFIIQDARGNQLQAGFSRKLGELPRPFYVGAKFSNDSGAKLLPIGGVEETALVAILNSWLGQHLSPDEQKFLAKYGTPQARRTRQDFVDILRAIEETEARRTNT